MSTELIPLKPGQHPVTRLPKFTTELPFFYLTKQGEALKRNIDFQTVDTEGRPLKWKVIPNRDPDIGVPGIEAHEVWVRLVKPAIDAQQKIDGPIPLIIPLGGARECLRILDWGIGGRQAARLLSRLDQIGSARCEADFWMPTNKTDEEGNPLYTHIKAKFSKFDIYAIGGTHLTAEEIRNNRSDFTFDLEDTIYLKLSEIEAQLQQAQSYRLVDNEYLFSVSPAARRWYELLAPRIYGVIKNPKPGQGPGFCEVRYSWYVERHHTLTRQDERHKVAQQMNKLIKDHLQHGYILKADYRALREPNQKPDFIIRYYPGHYAQVTTARILGRLAQQRRKKPEPVQLPLITDPAPATNEVEVENILALTPEEEVLVTKLCEVGITPEKAGELVLTRRESVERELEAMPQRNREGIKDLAAWLIKAIERGNYSQPKAISEKRAREKKQKAEAVARELKNAREKHELRFEKEHSDYVWQRVEEIKKSHPAAYRAFEEATLEERQKTERAFRNAPILAKKVLEGEIVNYFREHPDCPILDFWQWDSQLNPKTLRLPAET